MKSIEVKVKLEDCVADPIVDIYNQPPIVKDCGRDMNEVMQAEINKWQAIYPDHDLIWTVSGILSGKGPIGFNIKIDPSMKDGEWKLGYE